MSACMRLLAATALALCAGVASASETVSYSYDARGRLIKVARSGTVNDGVTACYLYDGADNRRRVQVAVTPVTCQTSASSLPGFTIGDASVTEGGTLSFTVTRSGSAAASVSYATADGTAGAGSDYTAKSGTLSFAAGDTTRTVSIATINDTAAESAETLYVTLSSPSGAVLIDAQGTGTINDNDVASTPVSFSVNDVSVTEGGILNFTVTKSGTATASHSVSYATSSSGSGAATAGTDYTPTSGTLTFTATQTAKTVSVSTIDDLAVELNKKVTLTLSNATGGATISDSVGIGTIFDDDMNVPTCGTQICNLTTTSTTLSGDEDPTGEPTADPGSDPDATDGTEATGMEGSEVTGTPPSEDPPPQPEP